MEYKSLQNIQLPYGQICNIANEIRIFEKGSEKKKPQRGEVADFSPLAVVCWFSLIRTWEKSI